MDKTIPYKIYLEEQSRRVVSFEFVINMGGSPQFFFQAVSSYQGRRTVHFIKVPDFLGNVEIRRCIVQLLFCQLSAEDT